MKAARTKPAETVSYAQIRALKARDRQRDWKRLARGEVTPDELQKENAAVRNTYEFRILNDAQSAAFFRRQLRKLRKAA